MFSRLRSSRGFSLMEVMVVVMVSGILLVIMTGAFSTTRDGAKARSTVSRLDNQAAALATWAGGQQEWDSGGTRLAALTTTVAASAEAGRSVSSTAAADDWVLATTPAQLPSSGDERTLLYRDVVLGGERVRLTRCSSYFGANLRLCGRVDLFPWGNDSSTAPTVTYRYLECDGCSSKQVWTLSNTCSGWPKIPASAPSPSGSGSACPTDGLSSDTSSGSTVTPPTTSTTTPSSTSSALFDLVVTIVGNGSVTSSPGGIDCGMVCDQSFLDGTSVTLTATPSSGETLTGWSGSGAPSACTTATPVPTSCTVTLSQARAVTASFSTATSSTALTYTQVSAGRDHSCAVTTAGAARCWGRNDGGQLGDGTTTARSVSGAVTGLTSGVSKVVAGGQQFSCALLTAGTVKCWGYDGNGQLGDGAASGSQALTPVSVVTSASNSTPLSGVTDIAAGYAHACALLSSGGVKCWGYGGYGQLGAGSSATATATAPVSVVTSSSNSAALSGAAAPLWSGHSYSCVRVSSAFQCWGLNTDSQLGIAATSYLYAPATPTGMSTVAGAAQKISGLGQTHACLVTSGGGARCSGVNSYGQIGDNTTTNRTTMTTPSGLSSGVAAISSGYYHSCALTTLTAVWCWGSSQYGQLGNGTIATGATIPKTLIPGRVNGLGVDNAGVKSISSGSEHTCAVVANDNIQCWGRNDGGQLGNNTTTSSSTPVTVR